MTPEGKIKKDCADFLAILKRRGLLLYWYNHTTGLYAGGKWRKRNSQHDLNGVADIIILLKDSTSIWMEVKAPGNTQSEEQIEFQKMVEDMGHEYVLVHGLDQCMLAMKQLFEKYKVKQNII